MVRIGQMCIDRYEAGLVDHSPFEVPVSGVAVSEKGRTPQGYISGRVAESACVAAGKRLCTSDEWLAACRGSDNTLTRTEISLTRRR